MEKGQGKRTDTLQTDNVFTRKEYIERDAAKKVICDYCSCVQLCSRNENDCWAIEALQAIPAADVRPVPEGGIGEMSDGYHTFNGLYYQRMVLFAALVKAHKDKAWKSWRHEDGELCFGGGWFIVGIDTPQGRYTYHYEDKYWNWFECQELPVAKHWDGHTEEDATRLLSLPDVMPVVRCKDCRKGIPDSKHATAYSCYGIWHKPDWFCAGGVRKDGETNG